MRRSIFAVPALVLAMSLMFAARSQAQVSPGHSGGNALAPSSEGSTTVRRTVRPERLGLTTFKRATPSPWAARIGTPRRVGLALADLRWLVRLVR
jgi:hypothetical protein